MTKVNGFELVMEQEIPELNTRGRLLRHLETGAELLSLENNDENKVFGISFRTVPRDSTGVAHILEHAVLCGSRKYPLKEPFVELMKGSLNTFLNAFTYPDKTCYPVASQNLQDFYNLIDVYLDAVFYPLIDPYTLQQEGWHYEVEEPDSPLAFKGVVFNEMKGNYSSPDYLLDEMSQLLLYPDNPYGVNSGGDPKEIPNLTYEEFKAFHERYYHPSNAFIFFYGDDDPEERLRILDAYLSDFKALDVDSNVPLQPKFDQPRREIIPYDAGASQNERKAFMTVNWLLPEVGDPRTTLGLNILDQILIGSPASPLRKALIDSGLGEELAGRGLETALRQMFFSTGLKGVLQENTGKVEDLVFKTLEKLASEGLDPDAIAAALNTVEFRLRENNTGPYPRGLVLMLRALTSWLHGGDPFKTLAFETPLAAIKEHIKGGGYFESLIRSHFLENPHRTTVILTPEPGLGEKQETAERERLDQAQAAMKDEDLLALIDETRELKRRQETPDSPEALATIPSLKLSDLDREVKRVPLEVLHQDGIRILYHDLFTNGILYLDVGFDLHTLSQELLPYVSLFGRALLEMGTEREDFVKLSQRIGRTTGGIVPARFTGTILDTGPGNAKEAKKGTAWLFLRGKALGSQPNELLEILRDVLLTARLDNQERFRQIVLEEKASQESRLVPLGHRVVNTRLRAHFSEADWAAERMDGLDYLFFLRQLADQVEGDWPSVLDKLDRMRGSLVNQENTLLNVTAEDSDWVPFQPRLKTFLESLPAAPAAQERWKPEPFARHEGLTVPAQVNYVGKGVNLYQLGYELHGSISVIVNYLRTNWLWEKIRVQGGAYGGFCLFDNRSGVMSFLSYRDPNLLSTLENYDQTGRFLRQVELSQDELTKNIIGAIGEMDAYQLPDAKGYSSMLRYLVGDTDERRQQLRDQVLSTTRADFRNLGEVLEQARDDGTVVVLGSEDAIQAANASRSAGGDGSGWLEVIKVL